MGEPTKLNWFSPAAVLKTVFGDGKGGETEKGEKQKRERDLTAVFFFNDAGLGGFFFYDFFGFLFNFYPYKELNLLQKLLNSRLPSLK